MVELLPELVGSITQVVGAHCPLDGGSAPACEGGTVVRAVIDEHGVGEAYPWAASHGPKNACGSSLISTPVWLEQTMSSQITAKAASVRDPQHGWVALRLGTSSYQSVNGNSSSRRRGHIMTTRFDRPKSEMEIIY